MVSQLRYLLLTISLLSGWLPARAQFGRFVWQANVGTAAKNETASQMIRLRRGGYVICGSHDTLAQVPVPFLAKVSEQGVVQWQRSYPLSGFWRAWANAVVENRSGQLLIAAYGLDSTGTGASFDAALLLTDSSGNVLWKKEYHSPLYEGFRSLQLDRDG